MKKLIIINGTMGVGKSTVCNILLNKLEYSVYLDSNWCWNMNPSVVSEENKEMTINNILYLLRAYLSNLGYKYIIFCLVIQEKDIFKQILDKLNGFDFELHRISQFAAKSSLKRD